MKKVNETFEILHVPDLKLEVNEPLLVQVYKDDSKSYERICIPGSTLKFSNIEPNVILVIKSVDIKMCIK